ncbi:xanthine dehydrogenase family protein molybdopterin-binding subunit [Ferruginibacter paludis]|uniref:xanthine dehydrogenase family protein molybdopterin-binding subunit n=1 Tax=Ferruginibacter paludis TaxID=1310417 RepID=UPI0025B39792|nr:xanthine dehydrogenase family protein molybdopterin-binding subunit [Ferruginibacter paludis]MDN3657410.1 xanthine dehydrogenase family protein molybdopterin-binding subunit [Ferruginibacter paludis]
MAIIGKPINRVDALLKVTGAAKYAAEFNQPNMVYAFPVRSTIAKGSVTAIDSSAAEKSAGVIKILTPENAPQLKAIDPKVKTGGMLGEQLLPLQDNLVYYFGQYIALVVAETYEQARAAASLVKVNYSKEKHAIDLNTELPNGYKPQKVQGEDAQVNEGKTAPVIDATANKISYTYTTPTENHHPMEPHASIAVWEGGDKLTLYDSTQGVMGARGTLAYHFSLTPENVQIVSPYVGGGFGCKGSQWGHMLLAAMAAKLVQRPVKLAITRQMMQTNVGRRPATQQKMAMATDDQGMLTAIRHHTDSYGNKSDFFEPSGKQTAVLYKAPLREITYKIAKLNIGTPTYMRAPGETPGTFALESAIDEMAYKMKMDPVAFRVLNHTAEDPSKKHPFSSENLLDCYTIGSEKIGWQQRKAEPGQLRKGKQLIGYGVATATYPAGRSAASAKVQLMADGSVIVQSASQDIGTGTYTIIAQTASETLGIPVEKITVKIGDSSFPPAPVSGGSMTTASVNPAVMAAAEMVRKELLALATADAGSSLKGRRPEDIGYADGNFFVTADKTTADSYADIMRRNNKNIVEACTTAMPASGSGLGAPTAPCMEAPIDKEENSDKEKYSFHSFGAQFAEVWVDEDFGTIRVKRFVSVQDVGRIMNEKTARSQIIGGVIYGIGAALMEETAYDHRWANPTTRTLADYHVPVNLDVPDIDVHFIGKPDPHISPIGARGIGEIGTTGVSAAIANAVFNATGKRLRDLPFTPDKMLLKS